MEQLSLFEKQELEEMSFDKAIKKVEKGDIWQLGDHRLMCGDSENKADIDKLVCVGGGTIDLLLTDPPYAIEYKSNKNGKFDKIVNDDKIIDFFPLVKDIVKGFVMIFTTWKVIDKWIPMFKNYYELTNLIIWNKGHGGMGDLWSTFATDYEIILCSNNGNKIKGKRIGSIWKAETDNPSTHLHPTQKPIDILKIGINHTTEKNDKVLDIFGGSGSTLLACEQLERKCYMMEIDPHYCDIIIYRWEKMTGKKAIKL